MDPIDTKQVNIEPQVEEEKKENTDMKKLITKVDNRVKTKVGVF
jgi:hypothetical protein